MVFNLLDPLVGDRIEIRWLFDEVFYAGKVIEVPYGGKNVTTYYDTKAKTPDMSEHSWRPVLDRKIQGNTDLLQLKFNSSSTFKDLLSAFGIKTFD